MQNKNYWNNIVHKDKRSYKKQKWKKNVNYNKKFTDKRLNRKFKSN
jgi:hypothetical protein